MSSSDAQRDPLEVLFSDFLERKRQGNAIDIEQFALEHANQTNDIRELFPTLLALEGVRNKEQTSDLFQTGEEISGGLMMGEYRLLREIGVGGMGIVYEAMQESIQRRVAVKVLPQEFTQQEIRKNRFMQEARTVAKLSYRNIVPIYDFGEADNRYFFAMRLIKGVGLDWLILRLSEDDRALTSTEVLEHFQDQGIVLSENDSEDDDDSLACEMNFSAASNSQEIIKHKWILKIDSWRQIARIGLQAARALNHAHQAGILHRDIKPGNLLLDEEGVIWITDFGLAKSENELSLTAANDVVGTLRYISPERFHGQVDARSDIYALGLTLIELCTLKPVFEQAGRSELIRNIMEGNVTPPRELNPNIPEAFENILLKATAKKPERRYQTAAEFVEDLLAFSRGAAMKSSALPPERKLPGVIGKNWLTFLLASVCIIQAIVLLTPAGRLLHKRETPEQLSLQRDQIQVRLDALDAFYFQSTNRKITHDLEHSLTIKRVPENSNQRATLAHLIPLLRSLVEDAKRHRLTKIEQQATSRLKLINRSLQ